MNIEVHHLIPEGDGGSNNIDNAMPLCFDCHSEVLRYSDDHPRGTKYKPEELKARREQVYEEFTRHLVPPIHAEVTQKIPGGQVREFPDVGFILSHGGDSLPVRVRVKVASILGEGPVFFPSSRYPLYSGEQLWNVNPRSFFSGHFRFPSELKPPEEQQLEVRVTISIIDQFGREHLYLPSGFVYAGDRNLWYAEP